jgi:hypothetical protein
MNNPIEFAVGRGCPYEIVILDPELGGRNIAKTLIK